MNAPAPCPMPTPPSKGVTYGFCAGCDRVMKAKDGARVTPCPLTAPAPWPAEGATGG